jgi:hypothetical protein
MAKSTKTQSTTAPRTARPGTPRTPRVNATTSDVSTTSSSLPHGDIAMRAYELYLADGAMPGRELDHWLKAESELRYRSAANGN